MLRLPPRRRRERFDDGWELALGSVTLRAMICSSGQRSAPAAPLWGRSGWPVERAVPARI